MAAARAAAGIVTSDATVYVGLVTDDVDLETSGMLDGLTGEVRSERAELIPWLLEQGITADEIRASFAPMLLPARRALGDDGTYVSGAPDQ